MIKDRSFQEDTDTYELASLSTARLMTEMDRVIIMHPIVKTRN